MQSSDPIARLLAHTLSLTEDPEVATDGAVGRIVSRTMQIGVWRMRVPEGDFVFSARARTILGLADDAEPIPVDVFLSRFSTSARKTAAMLIKGALEERRGFQVEAEVVDFHNHSRFLEYFGEVEFGPEGHLAGLVGTVRDVSAKRLAEQAATSRMLIIRSIMKHAPFAMAIFDRDMHYLAVSDYWVSGHGISSAKALIGRSHYEVFDIPEECRREHRQVLAGMILTRPRSFLKDKAGNPITQNATLAPWYEKPQVVGGMLIILAEVDIANAITPEKAISATPTAGEFDDLVKELA